MGRHLQLLSRFVKNRLPYVGADLRLYAPSPNPVGRTLSVRTAAEAIDQGLALWTSEALPARRIPAGDESVDAPPLQVLTLQEAKVVSDAHTFLAFLVDGAIIADVSVDYRSERLGSVRRLQRYPSSRRTISSGISLLTGHGGNTKNYFHWLYDVLPRLGLMEKAGAGKPDDAYVVPPLVEQYQVDTLRLLHVPLERCVPVEGATLIEAGQVSVSQGHRDHAGVDPWACQFLRSRLGSSDSGGVSRRPIYVNRRDTAIRRMTNEAQLEQALAARGIESVSLAGLAFHEQVTLFASAEVVVAPHGAGLANIVFCNPGTRVVEIGGGGHAWRGFESIAAAVGLDYRTVDALEAVGSSLLPTRVRDTRVDVRRALAAVDDALT